MDIWTRPFITIERLSADERDWLYNSGAGRTYAEVISPPTDTPTATATNTPPPRHRHAHQHAHRYRHPNQYRDRHSTTNSHAHPTHPRHPTRPRPPIRPGRWEPPTWTAGSATEISALSLRSPACACWSPWRWSALESMARWTAGRRNNMRNMSFMLTTEQMYAGTKTVTRRNGWWFLNIR